MSVKSTYKIHTNTFALISAKSIDYHTIVLEKHQVTKVQQTPMEIIQNACLQSWTTYEGRRAAVLHHTNFHKKVPIPISIQKRIYFFPTHSPKHIDNCWIANHSIESIEEVHGSHEKGSKTIIQFKDGQSIKLNVSKHTIQKQMSRTFQCMVQLETNNFRLLSKNQPEGPHIKTPSIFQPYF